MSPAVLAFIVTLAAGLATGIGSAIAFFAKRTDFRFLANALGFSAGVMLYVSFVEILPKGVEQIARARSERDAWWIGVMGFFVGLAIILVIDRLVPKPENPHEPPDVGTVAGLRTDLPPAQLMRMGTVTALAIAIHNFPEGVATFFSVLEDPKVGIAIAIAVALHNIPEGVSVSVPVYYATGSRKKAFLLSALSGIAEPIGGLVAFGLLSTIASPVVMGAIFCAVAGIMVFISIDELLPTAQKYGEQHAVVYWFAGGMGVMAMSLLLLKG